ncbi:MAG TPA: ATP-binding protein [Candidatus Acidoferrales bacterium]|nr:ATP-binding protein [Candidatus Acidoferrales bacterium]
MAAHSQSDTLLPDTSATPKASKASPWQALRSGQQRLIAIGSLLSIGGLVLLFSAAYRSNTRFLEWNNLVVHTRDVLRTLEDFSSAMKSGQLAAVEYYSNGGEVQVQALAAAQAAGRRALDRVRTLTVDNPKQQRKLEVLAPLADQGFELLHRVIELRQAGKSGPDAMKPVTDDARKISPLLASALADMIGEENRLLEQRSAEAAVTARRTRILQLIGGIFATGMVVGVFLLFLRENSARASAETRLRHANAQLRSTNRELEAFSYSVSHDLRAPLRGIDGFSQALLEDHSAQLDEQGKVYLQRVRTAVQRMGSLIDDLIGLSRIARTQLGREAVDLSQLARTVAEEVRNSDSARTAQFSIAPDLRAEGDPRLLRVVFQNLFGNSYKFTSKRERAQIEFGRTNENGKSAFFIKDNGAGFDPEYSSRLFGAFQRLHAASEFPGTGIGLATVQRIIHLHGGDIWAKGEPGRGATFFFTL